MTLGFYCTKLLLPLNLCYYSNLVVPYSGMGMLDLVLIAGGVLSAALMLIFWRKGIAGMAFAWIGISLLPVLNIITLPVLAKENYLYLPSVGFCLLAVLLFEKAARTVTPRIAALLFSCILLLFSMQVILRTIDYRDPADYLLSAVRSMPALSRQQLENKHYFEGAKNWFTTCRNLGHLYAEKKDTANAEQWFLRALNYTPAYFDPRYGAECRLALGKLYLKQNRIPEAQSQLTRALSDTKRAHSAYNLLGVAAAMQNDLEAAEKFFNKSLEIDPDYGSARANRSRLRRQKASSLNSP